MTVKPYLTEVRTVLTFSQSESWRRVRGKMMDMMRCFTGEVSDKSQVRDLHTGPAELEDHNED